MKTTTLFALAVAVAACGAPHRGTGTGADSGSAASGPGSGGPGPTTIPPDCATAVMDHSSVGCEYYAVDMDAAMGPPQDACFAVFVANTSDKPVHIQSQWNGQELDLSKYAKLPVGTGTSLTYGAYDPASGLAPGKVAILFGAARGIGAAAARAFHREGASVVVGPGVTVGDNSTIGAGSVVLHDVPANVVVAGNPCRIVRHV